MKIKIVSIYIILIFFLDNKNMMNKEKDIKEEEKQDDKWGKIMEETNELKRKINEIQKQNEIQNEIQNGIQNDISFIKKMLLKLLKKKRKRKDLKKIKAKKDEDGANK